MNKKRSHMATSKSRCIRITLLAIGIFTYAAAAMPQPSASTEKVYVSVVEPTIAKRMRESVSGTCFGRDVSVELVFVQKDTKPAIAVTISGQTRTYDTSTQFVRDLAFDTATADRMELLCDGKEVELAVFGVSTSVAGVGTEKFHYVISRPWQAAVYFSADGKFLRYGGRQPAQGETSP